MDIMKNEMALHGAAAQDLCSTTCTEILDASPSAVVVIYDPNEYSGIY
jgi:hypothetical protein